MKIENQERNWEHWANQQMDTLLLYAKWQARNDADAKDILQNVFLETWQQYEALNDQEYHALVCRRIKQRTIDFYRKMANSDRREVDYHEEQQIQKDGWFVIGNSTEDERHFLVSSIKLLDPTIQEIIILHLWNDRSFREISTILSIPKSTVQLRYRQGLDQLQLYFQKNDQAYAN